MTGPQGNVTLKNLITLKLALVCCFSHSLAADGVYNMSHAPVTVVTIKLHQEEETRHRCGPLEIWDSVVQHCSSCIQQREECQVLLEPSVTHVRYLADAGVQTEAQVTPQVSSEVSSTLLAPLSPGQGRGVLGSGGSTPSAGILAGIAAILGWLLGVGMASSTFCLVNKNILCLRYIQPRIKSKQDYPADAECFPLCANDDSGPTVRLQMTDTTEAVMETTPSSLTTPRSSSRYPPVVSRSTSMCVETTDSHIVQASDDYSSNPELCPDTSVKGAGNIPAVTAPCRDDLLCIGCRVDDRIGQKTLIFTDKPETSHKFLSDEATTFAGELEPGEKDGQKISYATTLLNQLNTSDSSELRGDAAVVKIAEGEEDEEEEEEEYAQEEMLSFSLQCSDGAEMKEREEVVEDETLLKTTRKHAAPTSPHDGSTLPGQPRSLAGTSHQPSSELSLSSDVRSDDGAMWDQVEEKCLRISWVTGFSLFEEQIYVEIQQGRDVTEARRALLEKTGLPGDMLEVLHQDGDTEFERHMMEKQADPEPPTPPPPPTDQSPPAPGLPLGGAVGHGTPLPQQPAAMPAGSGKETLHIGDKIVCLKQVTLGGFVTVRDARGAEKLCAITACESCGLNVECRLMRGDVILPDVIGKTVYVPCTDTDADLCPDLKCTVDMMLIEINTDKYDVDPAVTSTNTAGDVIPLTLQTFTGTSDRVKFEQPVRRLAANSLHEDNSGFGLSLEGKIAYPGITDKKHYHRALGVCDSDFRMLTAQGHCGSLITGYPDDGVCQVYGVVYGGERNKRHPRWGRKIDCTIAYSFPDAVRHLESRYDIHIDILNHNTKGIPESPSVDSGIGTISDSSRCES